MAKWAAAKHFKDVQIPTWDTRLIDMKQAAASQTYCNELKGMLANRGLSILNDVDAHGLDLAYQINPTVDLHDGHSWEYFLD